MDWMTQFFSQCSGCTVDEVLIHWYDVHFSDFQTYVENWYNAFKKPLRITEFACQVRVFRKTVGWALTAYNHP